MVIKENVYVPVEFRDEFRKLSMREIGILLKYGRKLFELMDLTKKAEEYLEYLPKLKEVVEKW